MDLLQIPDNNFFQKSDSKLDINSSKSKSMMRDSHESINMQSEEQNLLADNWRNKELLGSRSQF